MPSELPGAIECVVLQVRFSDGTVYQFTCDKPRDLEIKFPEPAGWTDFEWAAPALEELRERNSLEIRMQPSLLRGPVRLSKFNAPTAQAAGVLE